MKYIDAVSAYPYETPRVTFVGSDPKIPALRKAINRVARHVTYRDHDSVFGISKAITSRYVALWQARNRRTRVLMFKVRDANAR